MPLFAYDYSGGDWIGIGLFLIGIVCFVIAVISAAVKTKPVQQAAKGVWQAAKTADAVIMFPITAVEKTAELFFAGMRAAWRRLKERHGEASMPPTAESEYAKLEKKYQQKLRMIDRSPLTAEEKRDAKTGLESEFLREMEQLME